MAGDSPASRRLVLSNLSSASGGGGGGGSDSAYSDNEPHVECNTAAAEGMGQRYEVPNSQLSSPTFDSY